VTVSELERLNVLAPRPRVVLERAKGVDSSTLAEQASQLPTDATVPICERVHAKEGFEENGTSIRDFVSAGRIDARPFARERSCVNAPEMSPDLIGLASFQSIEAAPAVLHDLAGAAKPSRDRWDRRLEADGVEREGELQVVISVLRERHAEATGKRLADYDPGLACEILRRAEPRFMRKQRVVDFLAKSTRMWRRKSWACGRNRAQLRAPIPTLRAALPGRRAHWRTTLSPAAR
jgi:hypothetical protein